MNSKIFAPQEKVIANVDRALEIVKGNNPPPVLVEVDPSNACNHGCHFCISSYIHLPESKGLETYDRSIMPKKTLMKLCEDLADMGVRAVNWTGGGEPTINPALKDAINYLGPRNVKMGMFTNGTLLDKYELFTDLVSWMKWVRFSVDAGTMNTYNSIRRTSDGNNWNKMFVNLERLVKVRADFILFDRYMTHDKRVPFEPGQIIIGVGFVITPDNFVEVVDFAKVFKDIDVDYCQFKPEIVNLEREDGIQRDIEFWEKLIQLCKAHPNHGNKLVDKDIALVCGSGNPAVTRDRFWALTNGGGDDDFFSQVANDERIRVSHHPTVSSPADDWRRLFNSRGVINPTQFNSERYCSVHFVNSELDEYVPYIHDQKLSRRDSYAKHLKKLCDVYGDMTGIRKGLHLLFTV